MALRVLLAAVALMAFIVAPLHLLAVHPELPSWWRSSGRGLVAPAGALSNFWYRLSACGLLAALGTLLVYGLLTLPRRGR